MIRFNVPYLSGREEEYLTRVLASGSFGGNGPFTRLSQRWLEERFGAPHVLLTTSCTAALELAAMALGVGPGDEVIVPSFTFVATASAFHRAGATIIFADVDPYTMTVDVADVARKLTPRTRAVVPVHYAGAPCAIARLRELCSAHGAALVEDAAQGLDCATGGEWLGRFGRFAAFSFHETKNLHCGLGGALFVNDPSDFERTEDIWERGTNRTKMFRGLVDKYSWVEPGSSFYPTELQAAFLLAQLESMDDNRLARMARWERYRERLSGGEREGWFALQRLDPADRSNGHAVYVMLRSAEACEALRLDLLAREVQAHIHYLPLHSSKMGRALGYEPSDVPLTEEYAPRLLRMPLHNELTLDQVEHVCDLVDDAFRAGRVR